MARTDTFNNWATDIADSIREKTGKTDKIPAANFDTEIAAIQAGGDTTNEDGLITRELRDYTNTRVTTVGEEAFYGYAHIYNINMPNVITVGNYAFSGICYSGQSDKHTVINLPKATTIGHSAFDGSGSQYNQGYLKYNLPEALTFGTRCFAFTGAITHINPEDGDETASRFLYAPKITSIGDDCFTRSTFLRYADLKNITNIGSSAFGNTQLRTLILRGEQICNLSGGMGVTPNIYVRNDLVEDYKSATNWSAYADSITGIDLTDLIIKCSDNINTYLTDNISFEILYNGSRVPLLKPEQEGYTVNVVGNVTVEENTITLTEDAKVGDIITITVTSTYNDSIVSTKQIEVIYEKILVSVDTNNGQWIDSGTNVNGNIVYKSDAGSYNKSNGKSTAIISVNECSKITIYIKNSSEKSYDYIEAFALDTPAERSKGLFSGKDKTEYIPCVYELDGGPHTIQIMYSKDDSSNSGDDRGYFYIGEVIEV